MQKATTGTESTFEHVLPGLIIQKPPRRDCTSSPLIHPGLLWNTPSYNLECSSSRTTPMSSRHGRQFYRPWSLHPDTCPFRVVPGHLTRSTSERALQTTQSPTTASSIASIWEATVAMRARTQGIEYGLRLLACIVDGKSSARRFAFLAQGTGLLLVRQVCTPLLPLGFSTAD